MKSFFIKKNIFAFCFIGFLLLFSTLNVVHNKENILDMKLELQEIQSVDELKDWISSAETNANEEILGQMNFIEAYGYLQKLIGKREFNGFSYIKGDDGMLYYGSVLKGPTNDLQDYAQNVSRLNKYVESQNAKLIVVIPPSKILSGKSDINLQWPINDPNYRTDEFLNLLQRYQVSSVDLRTMMQKSDLDIEQMFFKTDHHWTPTAAFYAAGALVNYVRDHFDDDWDSDRFYCDIDNYNSYTYQNCMIGSQGKNAGVIYSGIEDYTLLWPKFETSFTLTDYEHNTVRKGDFSESLLNKHFLEIENWYKESINAVYLNEIVTKDNIVNHLNPDGPKIVALRDSYFSPMACFLAPMCSEIDMVWGKRGNRNQIDFDKFIRESEGYDYFILEVYPYNLESDSFMFFQEDAE